MARSAERILPGITTTTVRGTPGLDLPGAARSLLEARGVRVDPACADRRAWCTLEHDQLYSYRRDATPGRLACLRVAAHQEGARMSHEPTTGEAATASPGVTEGGDAHRTAELAQRVASVRQRILSAAQDRDEQHDHGGELPSLVVVTKFFPAEDVLRLRELGVRAVGRTRTRRPGRRPPGWPRCWATASRP